MTLVAFRVSADRVDLVTDSLSYAPEFVEHDFRDKVRHLPRWDVVVTGRGQAHLSDRYEAAARDVEAEISDLDDLARHTPAALHHVWTEMPEDMRVGSIGEVFLLGWSPRRGRYVALAFHHHDGFQPTDLSDQVVVRPEPGIEVPQRLDDRAWSRLAVATYQRWTVGGTIAGAVYIGGDVTRTSLTRDGGLERVRLRGFPTEGPQWRRALVGSLHDDGQLGRCICGSGLPSVACHLLNRDHSRPCPCRSGRTLGDCHLIGPDDPRVLPYYLRHLKEFERSRPALAAAYRRARPQENWPPPEILRLRGWKDHLREQNGRR